MKLVAHLEGPRGTLQCGQVPSNVASSTLEGPTTPEVHIGGYLYTGGPHRRVPLIQRSTLEGPNNREVHIGGYLYSAGSHWRLPLLNLPSVQIWRHFRAKRVLILVLTRVLDLGFLSFHTRIIIYNNNKLFSQFCGLAQCLPGWPSQFLSWLWLYFQLLFFYLCFNLC